MFKGWRHHRGPSPSEEQEAESQRLRAMMSPAVREAFDAKMAEFVGKIAESQQKAGDLRRATDALLAELKRRLASPEAHEDYLQRHPDMRERLGEFDPNWPR
jgi:predicted nucleic acid-binding protein